jgi:hypothetical protein
MMSLANKTMTQTNRQYKSSSLTYRSSGFTRNMKHQVSMIKTRSSNYQSIGIYFCSQSFYKIRSQINKMTSKNLKRIKMRLNR